MSDEIIKELATTKIEAQPTTNLPAELVSNAPVIEGTIYESPAVFEHVQRIAKVFAACSLIPDHYRQNLPNCIIGVQMAMRLGVDPFMFLQNSYVVHGKPGIEGKLAAAVINAKAPIVDYLHYDYEGEGDSRKCTAWVTHKSGEKLSVSMTIKEVKDWGWWSKKDSNWPKMPDQMLAYRTAIFLARRYFPEVLLGLKSVEELRDIAPESDPFKSKVASLTAELVA